jgi:hypothetical protein
MPKRLGLRSNALRVSIRRRTLPSAPRFQVVFHRWFVWFVHSSLSLVPYSSFIRFLGGVVIFARSLLVPFVCPNFYRLSGFEGRRDITHSRLGGDCSNVVADGDVVGSGGWSVLTFAMISLRLLDYVPKLGLVVPQDKCHSALELVVGGAVVVHTFVCIDNICVMAKDPELVAKGWARLACNAKIRGIWPLKKEPTNNAPTGRNRSLGLLVFVVDMWIVFGNERVGMDLAYKSKRVPAVAYEVSGAYDGSVVVCVSYSGVRFLRFRFRRTFRSVLSK